MSENEKLLSVRNLRTYFDTEDGLVKAVDGVNFDLAAGETFALVGESGCGKSVTAFSILRLLQMPPAIITTEPFLNANVSKLESFSPQRRDVIVEMFNSCLRLGKFTPGDNGMDKPWLASEILFEGVDLLQLSERKMRNIRGGKISMIFQEPMSSLNPVFTCGNQIVEAIRLHRKMSRAEAHELAVELLDMVGIPDPSQRFNEYPHQLSGGMRQRVMIAMALSADPKLIIADEPTTALDVTIQAQILQLMRELQEKRDLGIMLITHDLAVVAETAHRVAVMYASKIVETSDVAPLFAEPLHPYTRGLFRSLPSVGKKTHRLETIPGTVPNPLCFPAGCKFHPRCELGRDDEKCQTQEPTLRQVQPAHHCACWKCPGYENAPPSDMLGDNNQ